MFTYNFLDNLSFIVKRLFWVLLLVFPLLVATIFLSYEFYALQRRSMPVNKQLLITIPKNTNATSFVSILKAKHLITSSKPLLLFIKLQHSESKLKAGTYKILPGESVVDLLKKVVLGDVLVLQFTIIEGSTLNQVIQNIKQSPNMLHNPKNVFNWQEIVAANNAEGLLLAETYNYNVGTRDEVILMQAAKKLSLSLENYWQNRSPNLPYKSAYELLIAASIIEKEAYLACEKKVIASVLVNRLKKNMRLQMDPSVIYGLHTKEHRLLTHNDLKINSSYNTYLFKGLPPTPIAMVGKAALEAAAHPLPTKYLYFVAVGDGRHCFSTNYIDQIKAVARYKNFQKAKI